MGNKKFICALILGPTCMCGRLIEPEINVVDSPRTVDSSNILVDLQAILKDPNLPAACVSANTLEDFKRFATEEYRNKNNYLAELKLLKALTAVGAPISHDEILEYFTYCLDQYKWELDESLMLKIREAINSMLTDSVFVYQILECGLIYEDNLRRIINRCKLQMQIDLLESVFNCITEQYINPYLEGSEINDKSSWLKSMKIAVKGCSLLRETEHLKLLFSEVFIILAKKFDYSDISLFSNEVLSILGVYRRFYGQKRGGSSVDEIKVEELKQLTDNFTNLFDEAKISTLDELYTWIVLFGRFQLLKFDHNQRIRLADKFVESAKFVYKKIKEEQLEDTAQYEKSLNRLIEIFIEYYIAFGKLWDNLKAVWWDVALDLYSANNDWNIIQSTYNRIGKDMLLINKYNIILRIFAIMINKGTNRKIIDLFSGDTDNNKLRYLIIRGMLSIDAAFTPPNIYDIVFGESNVEHLQLNVEHLQRDKRILYAWSRGETSLEDLKDLVSVLKLDDNSKLNSSATIFQWYRGIICYMKNKQKEGFDHEAAKKCLDLFQGDIIKNYVRLSFNKYRNPCDLCDLCDLCIAIKTILILHYDVVFDDIKQYISQELNNIILEFLKDICSKLSLEQQNDILNNINTIIRLVLDSNINTFDLSECIRFFVMDLMDKASIAYYNTDSQSKTDHPLEYTYQIYCKLSGIILEILSLNRRSGSCQAAAANHLVNFMCCMYDNIDGLDRESNRIYDMIVVIYNTLESSAPASTLGFDQIYYIIEEVICKKLTLTQDKQKKLNNILISVLLHTDNEDKNLEKFYKNVYKVSSRYTLTEKQKALIHAFCQDIVSNFINSLFYELSNENKSGLKEEICGMILEVVCKTTFATKPQHRDKMLNLSQTIAKRFIDIVVEQYKQSDRRKPAQDTVLKRIQDIKNKFSLLSLYFRLEIDKDIESAFRPINSHYYHYILDWK